MRRMRRGFSIIEILVSTIIISVSIVYVLGIYSSNHEEIAYIAQRGKHAFADSLFLDRSILDRHGDETDAKEALDRAIRPKDDETRELLKKIKRRITIDEPITIMPPPEVPGPVVEVQPLHLKGLYPSTYWRMRVIRF